MTGKLTVVVGAQYGSEGKGAISAALTKVDTAVVRVAGPNAGHTAVDIEGRTWALRQIPVGAVVGQGPVVIAAGSEIDPQVLAEEIRALDEAGHSVTRRLYIDEQATMIADRHKAAEAELIGAVGSTGKGIGAARADRLMRTAEIYGSARDRAHPATAEMMLGWLSAGGHVLVEGTQGYGLGLHAGHYPQCTSSDTRALDMLAMAGISPWAAEIDQFEVVIVARTNPIRVAGNSGPLKGETSWDELGLPIERTTVTKKVRRVGRWDPDLVRSAVIANGRGKHTSIALTMFDHRFPVLAGRTSGPLPDKAIEWIERIEQQSGVQVRMLGTGPKSWINRGEDGFQ